MSGLNKYTDMAWERFFEFLYPCDENLTREEVQEKLKRFGISVDKAVRKVQSALAAAKGRAELADARSRRLGVVGRLTQVVTSGAESLRERLNTIIAAKTTGSLQAAYFKKLEMAATDDDLLSLLDDIHRLDLLSEESGDKP